MITGMIYDIFFKNPHYVIKYNGERVYHRLWMESAIPSVEILSESRDIMFNIPLASLFEVSYIDNVMTVKNEFGNDIDLEFYKEEKIDISSTMRNHPLK